MKLTLKYYEKDISSPHIPSYYTYVNSMLTYMYVLAKTFPSAAFASIFRWSSRKAPMVVNPLKCARMILSPKMLLAAFTHVSLYTRIGWIYMCMYIQVQAEVQVCANLCGLTWNTKIYKHTHIYTHKHTYLMDTCMRMVTYTNRVFGGNRAPYESLGRGSVSLCDALPPLAASALGIGVASAAFHTCIVCFIFENMSVMLEKSRLRIFQLSG